MTNESIDNAIENSAPEEISIQAVEEKNRIIDIPAPASEVIEKKADSYIISEDAPGTTVQIKEEVDFALRENIATKEISSNRMAQAKDLSAIQIDSQNIGAISTLSNTSAFSPNTTLSSVTVQDSRKRTEKVVVTKKKSYSLAENPSDLKNLVTIY
jgi:hypothetical protein